MLLASCTMLLPRMVLLMQEQRPAGPCRCASVDAGSELAWGSAALGRRVLSELELAVRKGIQLWAFSSSLFLSPVNRCSGSSGGGHAAQLHGAGGDNLGDTRRNYPVCQTDLCGDAGGTVCNKGGKVHRKKNPAGTTAALGAVDRVSRTLHHALSDHSHFLVPCLKPTQCVFPAIVRCF